MSVLAAGFFPRVRGLALLVAVLSLPYLAGCNAGETATLVPPPGDGSGSGTGSGSGSGGGTGTGSGSGSGSGGGTGGGDGGVKYRGPTAVDMPARFLAERVLCTNGIGRTTEQAGTLVERGAALGLAHVHAQSAATWQADIEGAMRAGGVAAGHLDADCWTDLAFNGPEEDGIVLYRNQAGAGYAESTRVPLDGPATGVVIADINGDALSDLVAGNLLPGDLQVLAGDADGAYSDIGRYPMATASYGMALTDLAVDGWLDLFVAHWDEGGVDGSTALLGGADDGVLVDADAVGGFLPGDVDRRFHFSPAFVPLDAPEYPGLLVAADRGSSDVFVVVDMEKYFSVVDRAVVTAESGHASVVADFNGDGAWDWFVTAVAGPGDARDWPWGRSGNRLYAGNGDGTFLDITAASGLAQAGWAWGACAADFDNDGSTDLFVTGGFGAIPPAVAAVLDPADVAYYDSRLDGYESQRPYLFLNDGNGIFRDASADWGLAGAINGRGVACLDHDRDGDMDVAVAQNEAAPLLYENRHGSGAGRHFLSISLQGDRNNHDALGAVVEVTAGGRTQLRQAVVNSNYLGQDARELHIGVGAATLIDRVEVRWPDGKTTVLEDVPADRFLEIADPDLNPASTRQLQVDRAIARALEFLGGLEGVEARADVLVVMEVLERRYAVDFGFDPLAELDAIIARLEAGDDEEQLAARIYSLYRRWVDAGQLPTWPLDELSGIDALTMPALYCREEPFPAGYLDRLRAAPALGGYQATHAQLALLFLATLGCDAGLSAADIRAIAAGNAAVLDLGDKLLDDVDIEVMLFMTLAGDAGRIRPEWMDLLLETQQESGGWLDAMPIDGSAPARAAEDHPSVLALWLLLALRDGSVSLDGLVEP